MEHVSGGIRNGDNTALVIGAQIFAVSDEPLMACYSSIIVVVISCNLHLVGRCHTRFSRRECLVYFLISRNSGCLTFY